MPPSSPKPPDAPARHPANEEARWLTRPDRAPAAKTPPANAPAQPAASAPSEASKTPSVPPNALRAEAGVGGGWGTYAKIAGIVVLVCGAVITALVLIARAPVDRESAAQTLSELGHPTATPSAAPTPTPSPTTPMASPNGIPIPPPLPSATASAAPNPTPAPSASETATPAPSGDEGTISTPANAAGHRVFVDGKYAGDSPGPIKVRCGPHTVKVGSGGTARKIEVPCGGDAVVTVR